MNTSLQIFLFQFSKKLFLIVSLFASLLLYNQNIVEPHQQIINVNLKKASNILKTEAIKIESIFENKELKTVLGNYRREFIFLISIILLLTLRLFLRFMFTSFLLKYKNKVLNGK